MKARTQAWCRELSIKMEEASRSGDTERFKMLRRTWIRLQRQCLETMMVR